MTDATTNSSRQHGRDDPGGILRFALRKKRVRRGNHAQLLSDGDGFFPALTAALKAAQTHIHMEYYIWRGDQTGWHFADVLIERARAGVAIRVMIDAWGCMDVDPLIFDTMRSEGIDVAVYKPLSLWRAGLLRRDHRKLTIVDHRVGFIGGVNIADDYASIQAGGHGWRDSAIQLEGPIVHDMERLMLANWHSAVGTAREPARASREPLAGETIQVALLANSERGQRRRIINGYMHAIKHASETIWIANAYFLPGPRIRRALRAAVGRGVDVRVLIPKRSDVRVVQWATNHLLPRLANAGISVSLWPGAMMHAKIACIDGVWSTVGSYNLDRISLRANLEANAMVLGPEFGRHMNERFRQDFAVSQALRPTALTRRTWLQRLRDWFFYQFRGLL